MGRFLSEPGVEFGALVAIERITVQPGGPQSRLFVGDGIVVLLGRVHELAFVSAAFGAETVLRIDSGGSAARSNRRARACCFSTVLTAMPRRSEISR